MSPEARRIAIAEACGYKRLTQYEAVWSHKGSKIYTVGNLPDYLNSLDAMHKVEETADYHVGDYVRFLQLVISGGKIENMTGYNLLHATAAQRAEAFLRTVGKWQD